MRAALSWAGGRRLVLCATASLALTTGLAVPGEAAPEAAPAIAPAAVPKPTNALRLASQTPWVGPGEEFVLRLGVTTKRAPTDVELAVAVYRRVTSRSEFTRTVHDGPRGNPVTTMPPATLATLTPDAAGAIVVRLPTQNPDQPVDPARLHLGGEGVYPVRVELRETGGGKTLAGLVTDLVYTRPPQLGGYPLKVAMVLPVHAPPALRPNGTRVLSSAAAGGLQALSQSLQAFPGVPLTLLPTPESLVSLATSKRSEDRDVVIALAKSITGRQIAARTYVPVSLASFADSGMGAEAAIQLDRGSEVIEQTLGRRPDPRTWVAAEGIDERTTIFLRRQQVDRLVVPEADLDPVKLSITLTQPFEIAARAVRRPLALSIDSGLVEHFSPTADPVLAAHQFLADLAVVYQDRPSRPSVVVVVPPLTWLPNRAFLDTLLNGLATATITAGTTMDDAFTSVMPATTLTGEPLLRRLKPSAVPATAALPGAAIATARRHLVSFASMLSPENALDDHMEQLLLLAEGAGLTSARRQEFLRALDSRVRSHTSSVFAPDHRSITLTARTGEIPVTVLSKTGFPLKVQIRVESDKLDFPNGAVRNVDLTRRSSTEHFSVRARTSGSFLLRVSLVSPDGALVLGTSRFTVRSKAASGVGIGLSAGAGAFLLLWWVRHLLRGRRNRHLVPT